MIAKRLIKLSGKLRQKARKGLLALFLLQLAFPDNMDLPAVRDKRRFVLRITFLVAVELCHPILGVLLRQGKLAVWAAMPIATVLLEKLVTYI